MRHPALSKNIAAQDLRLVRSLRLERTGERPSQVWCGEKKINDFVLHAHNLRSSQMQVFTNIETILRCGDTITKSGTIRDDGSAELCPSNRLSAIGIYAAICPASEPPAPRYRLFCTKRSVGTVSVCRW